MSTCFQASQASHSMSYSLYMKKEGSGNVTGLKFENRTRTQARARGGKEGFPFKTS